MIERGVNFIQHHIAKGGSVYVHCKAGRARSATIALCYLVADKHMTAEEAQQYLLEKRPHINPLIYQRKVVKDFVADLEKKSSVK
jgi:atypical dual specificity phosphatase